MTQQLEWISALYELERVGRMCDAKVNVMDDVIARNRKPNDERW